MNSGVDWYTVTDVLKERSAFLFRVKDPRIVLRVLPDPEAEGISNCRNVG